VLVEVRRVSSQWSKLLVLLTPSRIESF
jgi:hypothetical protein